MNKNENITLTCNLITTEPVQSNQSSVFIPVFGYSKCVITSCTGSTNYKMAIYNKNNERTWYGTPTTGSAIDISGMSKLYFIQADISQSRSTLTIQLIV